MKKHAASLSGQDSNQITVLSVGSAAEDDAGLKNIIACSQWPSGTIPKMEITSSLETALSILYSRRVPIVLCDSDLGDKSWRELLDQLSGFPDPPYLIVTSRLADEYLWAEALNLGAYDVLAKPFDSSEVTRVLSSAWIHRQHSKPSSSKAAAAGIGLAG